MVPSESCFAYMQATRAYIEAHGKPVAFHSDKHSVLRVHTPSAAQGDGMTQFGRALDELNIEIICANSAPAKGRVERAHQTLQDRLVKEMRLAGICDVDAANAFLPAFMERHNARFAVEPFNAKDLHRPLAIHDDIETTMAWRQARTVSASLTLLYNNVIFILEPSELSHSAIRKQVMVSEYCLIPAERAAAGPLPPAPGVRQSKILATAAQQRGHVSVALDALCHGLHRLVHTLSPLA